MTMGTATWAQRGMGDDEGVVRQSVETKQIAVEGTINGVNLMEEAMA